MKCVSLAATFVFSSVALLGVGCSTADTITTGSGGSGGSAAAVGGSAGTSPTGVVGGSTTTGGSTTGTAGTTATGGMMTTAGATSTGGTGGSGPSTGGTGGGTSGGSGGSGGGTADGSCTGDCTTLVGKMDGWANIDPPGQIVPPDGIQGAGSKDGVATASCAESENRPDHGVVFKEAHWQLKGPGIVAGTNYAVTIGFTGVLECKEYTSTGMCPRAANAGRDAAYDLWCPGAMDPPLTSTPNHWNTVMVSVTGTPSATTPNIGPQDQGPLPAAGNWWMLNECPQGVQETHKTWKVDYQRTITVPGESYINFVEFDTNCREIINCGNSDDAAGVCTSHYSITPQNAVPAPPASVTTQPASAGAGGFGQWLYFDVKSIAKM